MSQFYIAVKGLPRTEREMEDTDIADLFKLLFQYNHELLWMRVRKGAQGGFDESDEEDSQE
jgi:hypothetical protein